MANTTALGMHGIMDAHSTACMQYAWGSSNNFLYKPLLPLCPRASSSNSRAFLSAGRGPPPQETTFYRYVICFEYIFHVLSAFA